MTIRDTRHATLVLAIAALGLATFEAPAVRAADAPACRLLKIDEIPITFVQNQPLVDVVINGKPGKFIVDTGSVGDIMFGGALPAFGLTRQESNDVEFQGVGGSQASYMTRIADFKLASIEQKNLTLFVIGRYGTANSAGLLGREFLGRYDVELDLADHVIRRFKPENCGQQSLAYWTKTPEVVDFRHDDIVEPYRIKVLLNGHAINAILDSGATTSVITPDAAAQAGLKESDYEHGQQHYDSGIGQKRVAFRIGTFETVTIGDEQIKHAKLEVADLFGDNTVEDGHLAARVGDGTEMLLGADFLRSHRVFLVTSQGRIYFTYSGGPVFQVVGDAVKPKDDAAPSAPPSPVSPVSPGAAANTPTH